MCLRTVLATLAVGFSVDAVRAQSDSVITREDLMKKTTTTRAPSFK